MQVLDVLDDHRPAIQAYPCRESRIPKLAVQTRDQQRRLLLGVAGRRRVLDAHLGGYGSQAVGHVLSAPENFDWPPSVQASMPSSRSMSANRVTQMT